MKIYAYFWPLKITQAKGLLCFSFLTFLCKKYWVGNGLPRMCGMIPSDQQEWGHWPSMTSPCCVYIVSKSHDVSAEFLHLPSPFLPQDDGSCLFPSKYIVSSLLVSPSKTALFKFGFLWLSPAVSKSSLVRTPRGASFPNHTLKKILGRVLIWTLERKQTYNFCELRSW